jgi:hypothetical protein
VACLSAVLWPSVGLIHSVRLDLGVSRRAWEKHPDFASDGDVRGCRVPLWRRCHDPDYSSPTCTPGETLEPVGRMRPQRHLNVAPFLKALHGFLTKST